MSRTTQNSLNLKEFLQVYPWQKYETQGRRPLDFLWKFTLPESVESLWPFLIDTSTFNKLLGLPLMTYIEKDGKLFGTATNAGIVSEWEEVPWEWEYHKGLNNARIYSRGFATYVRSRYLLKSTPTGTDFYVYFGWIPRNFWGRWLLKSFGMPQLKKSYARVTQKIAGVISQRRDFEERQRAIYAQASPPATDDAARQTVAALAAKAIADGAIAEYLNPLAELILAAPEEELARIRLKVVARRLQMPLSNVVHAGLYAARAGLLTLSWDVTCPHCRGVRKSAETLGDVPGEERCEACDITFSTQEIGNMEVVFHVNPEIRPTEKKFYCAAEPATKRHIFIQRRVAAHEKIILATDLGIGEYRARVQGNKRYLPFSVSSSGEKSGVIGKRTGVLKLAEAPELIFENPHDKPETLIIEKKDEDNDALRPAELFSLQLFRDLFGNQSLAEGLKVELGLQNILFTDIVGSTALYHKTGDGEAFTSVRKHFQKTYEIVRRHGGAVVKTIGDSAMVAFADALQSMRAALEIQQSFNGDTESGGVYLRVSMHSGPCLAVNLNSGIDYFGNTVNYAAKLQQFAGAKEIAFSPELMADVRVQDFIAARKLSPAVKVFSPAWSEKPFDVLVVKIS